MSKLREWREGQGIIAADAGARIGVSQTTWTRYETGERLVSVKSLPKVAELTGLSFSDIRPDLAHVFTASEGMENAG